MKGWNIVVSYAAIFSSRKQNIGRHQSTVHGGVGYLCKQWDKQYYWKENFCEHQREAYEGFKYPCGQCLEQFSQNGNMRESIPLKQMQLSSHYK